MAKNELLEKRRAGNLRKLEYETLKQKVLEKEVDNYSHIFVLKTTDDWYKIMSHSALMYIHYVWPIAKDKLNLTSKPPKLIADSDFRYKAPIGVVSRKDLEAFEKNLLAAGAKKVGTKGVKDGNVVVYKLARAMSEDEFWKIKKTEDDLWSKANTVITPKAVYPDLAIDIESAAMQIYFVARGMQRTDREFFGREMLTLTKTLAKGIILTEKGYEPWKTFFDTAPGVVAELYANITLLSNFRLIDNKVLVRLNDCLLKIEEDLKKAKKDYAKRCGRFCD